MGSATTGVYTQQKKHCGLVVVSRPDKREKVLVIVVVPVALALLSGLLIPHIDDWLQKDPAPPSPASRFGTSL
jgi:invasion protein IalB